MTEDLTHFVETHRTDAAHWTQFAKHRQNGFGTPDRHDGEFFQNVQPFIPCRSLRQTIEKLDDWKRKVSQGREALQLTLQMPSGRFRFSADFSNLLLQFVFQSIKPPNPSIVSADNGSIDQKPFPLVRRS